jgi:hypothetical protein
MWDPWAPEELKRRDGDVCWSAIAESISIGFTDQLA